jgi:hypothetical protein
LECSNKGEEMISYEEAARRWGIEKLNAYPAVRKNLDEDSVSVDFVMDEGYACCGGSDPDCYCSFAESPKLTAVVSYRVLGKSRGPKPSITLTYIDFAETLKEMFEVGAVD